MQIEHTDDGKNGRFFVQNKAGYTLAEMTYVWAGDKKFIIDHTEVDDSLQGQGVGKQMVERAVDYARTKGVTIMPLCPFAKSVFDKTPEFRDVL